MESVSIGNELKDSYKRVDKWVKSNISWLSEVENFYKQRATIEREYADKLNQLTSESFKNKAKATSVLSVGEDPVITPGSLESASMVAWTEILTQAESIAKQRTQLARDFDSRIAADVRSTMEKYESIRTRWKGANDEIIHIRDKNYEEVKTKKKLYDEACQAMENRRAKSERNRGSSTGSQEKLQKKEQEMNVAKNRYLLSINVANRLKDKYYYQDIPEILDGLQSVNEAKVSRLNSILLSSAYFERKCNEKISQYLKTEDTVVQQNLPRLDTAMFVKHNMGSWKEPADFLFEPSPIWHDDETMVVEEGSVELEDLKIKLGESSSTYEKYGEICMNEKQDVAELLDERNKLLGDSFKEVKIKSKEDYAKFEILLVKSITSLQQFTADDSKRVSAEVEIEVIQSATNGKDMTITRPIHKQKKSRFGLFRKKKEAGGSDELSEEGSEMRSLSSSISKISINPGNSKMRVFSGIGKKLGLTTSVIGAVGSTTATARFTYDAAGDDELSVTAGEALTVIEVDDGSGWTVVANETQTQGLVPTSYIEVEQQDASTRSSSPKKVGPRVAPRKGAKRIKYMEILYDYSPQGDDELDVKAGEKIVVVSGDDGSGWTEGEVNGERGLFPTSYAKDI
ncbi:hypothetical protein FOA43_001326 [Brettanomyces nanus]|uniref:Protein BZZ1 n=1 Tax=Eeniella nana TaxID=13502 RepID=A0A875S2F4_EENNA|nr:uncharacterized protein FOA43_001326 [Brettanomyces nanus]QPG74009.1 hypothetical protein FOA43_001326 [Brettanomyces nanus]